MKKTFLFFLILLILLISGWYYLYRQEVISPIGRKIIPVRPLEKYTYDNLRKTVFSSSQISLGAVLKDAPLYTEQIFYYKVGDKKVSGVINLPKQSGIYPVIVMFRGYVDQPAYQSGIGTEPSASQFAQSGFITLAPDFLDYGESAKGAKDPFENRFQTYTTALTLLASLGNLNSGLAASYSGSLKADVTKVGIWGHSNGGQIALSVLEITGKPYPTILLAPVSQMFPYSILYYIDEADDHGKSLIKLVANFEDVYDAEKYSLTNYLDWITAPIELHQGGADVEVPQFWSDQLVKTLQDKNKDITYYTYPGENHNFLNGSFPTVTQRSISFYQSRL